MPLQITFTGTEIADYLRVDPDQETATINTLKAAAMDEAEQFLNTDFSTVTINPDGTTTITPNEAPAGVKLWVLSRISQTFEKRVPEFFGVGAISTTKPDYVPLKKYRKLPGL